MEFTPELSAFQGVIISSDNVYPFSRLTEKGGNEEKITFLINNILKFLKDKEVVEDGLVDNKVPQARKFALYIILNANLRTLEQLVDKEEIDLVIWTIPTIPKLLMCEFLYNLHMEQFLYEVIVYSYPPLAIEVTAAILDHLKYSNPVNSLDRLRKLAVACYTLICKLHLFNFEENTSKTLTDASNNLQKCINYFIDPPNSGKLSTLNKNDLYKYKGNCLTSVLLFVYDCLTQFTSKLETESSDVDNIYQLTYLAGSFKQDINSYNISDCSKEMLDLLNKSNETMLDTCKQLVMDVSVDIFCAWSEFEDNNKTMQQTIGELCHKLRTKLLSIDSVSEHPLVSMMEQISRKPADINDLINSTDVAIIKEKINNKEDGKLWICALINRDQLCSDTELLDVINANLQDYNEDDSYKLYNILKRSLENKDYTNMLAVKAFHQCNISAKYELLDNQFPGKYFKDMQETAVYKQMMVETFNKLVIQPDADLSDVLTLFLQNPRQIYTKVFNLALENPQQTDIMLRVVKLLEKYSDYCYESESETCVMKVMQDTLEHGLGTEVKQSNFIRFLSGLKNNIFPGTKILLIIMPYAHQALLNEDIPFLNVLIRIVAEAFVAEELLEHRAPMLALIAQVFEVVRWKLQTFTTLHPITLQNAINFQKSLMDTYNNSIPDDDATWLRTKVERVHPINMYYYRQLYNPPGNNMLEIISGMIISTDMNMEHLTTLLTRLLYMATQDEWCEIWDSLSVLEDTEILSLFYEAVMVICTAEKMASTPSSWSCLLYNCRSFIYILRYKFLKEPLTNEQVITVAKKIAALSIVKKGKPEEVEPLLLPLFSYLYEKRDQYTYDLSTSYHLSQMNLIGLIAKVFMRGSE